MMNRLWSYIRRLLWPLLKPLKTSTPLIIALILLLLIIAIWWLGPEWQIKGTKPFESLASRITATVLILVAPLFFWTLSTRSKYKKLETQHKYEKAVELDPCIPYVQAQDKQLNINLQNLKANSITDDFLYKLPWFLVLGQENSGKTSLVNRSNQNFSLTGVIRAGARKTNKDPYLAYSVDWWVGNEAILIDPPGEIISQIEPEYKKEQQNAFAQNRDELLNEEKSSENTDSSETVTSTSSAQSQDPSLRGLPIGLPQRLWSNLIDWLDKNRSRRPLNGIIITIDLPTLINQTPSERKAFAVLIRARLFEMSQKLGTRLPLYLVLTKFDLIEGFDEFFAKLPRSVREDIFGFTFTLDSISNFDSWLDEFTKSYDALVDKIKEQIFDDIGLPHTLAEREHLLSFIAQLAGVRNMLIGFLTEMLGSDGYTTPALVRGIYFSSVYQQGLLSNAFIKEASKTYHLKQPILQAKEANRGVIYFAQKLFKDVIYPEAGLAGDNVKVLRQKRRALIANAALAFTVCAVAIGGWQIYYKINRDKAQQVLVVAQEYSRSDIDNEVDFTGRNLLPPLNQIRSAVSIFGDYRTAWPTKDIGLYEGRKIGPKVDEAYLHLLANRFLTSLGTGLYYQMGNAPEGSDEQLAMLRVYRMIENKDNRRINIPENWMRRYWQASFPNDGVVQDQLMDHFHYAMLYTQADLPQYQPRISEYQAILRRIPMQQRVYNAMRTSANNVLVRPLDLRNAIGPSFGIVFTQVNTASTTQTPSNLSYTQAAGTDQLVIDAIFTASGFREYFEPRSKEVADLAMIDEWVLGERDSIRYSDEDKAALSQKINDLYINDYINAWRRALYQFEVTDFNDIQHAVTVLETVTGTYAPFKRLLETIKENSEIYSSAMALPSPAGALATAEAEANNATGNTANARVNQPQPLQFPEGSLQANSLRITRTFSALDGMLQTRNNEPSSYEDVISAVTSLYEYMKVVQESPDRGKTALQLVMDRFELRGPDPISNLLRMSTSLPDPMSRHTAKLAQQSERVLMIEALRELEVRWDTEVYRFYSERLAPSYPFNASSKQDASLDDFERFFGPQGILQEFQNKYLNAFLRDNINTLQSQGGYLVRADVLNQLERANAIRDAFFNSKGTLNVQFSIQPIKLDNSLSSLLNADGQLIPYRHGPMRTVDLMWPNTLSESATSKFTLVNGSGGSSEISYRGPWSLYRLLSRAQLITSDAHSVELRFAIGNSAMRYRIISEKTNNPFTQQLFNGFSLPRTLLNNSHPKPAEGNTSGS